jgi:uncharacterized membrane protein
MLATTSTILIVFAFTNKLVLSTGVGAVEIVIKLLLYYLHERCWLFIGKEQFYGRQPLIIAEKSAA